MNPFSTNDPSELFQLIVHDYATCSRVSHGKLSIDGARIRTMLPHIVRLSAMTGKSHLDVYDEILNEVRLLLDQEGKR